MLITILKKMLAFQAFLTILIFCLSCKGPSYPEKQSTDSISQTTVKTSSQLGKSTPIIFQDSKNDYWFASNGIVHYDGNKVTKFTSEDGLISNQIRGIQEDHLGNIYFDTGKGVNRWNGKEIEQLKISKDSISQWKFETNDLWFAGNWNSNGPLRFDGEVLHQLEFPKHKFHEEFYAAVPNASFSPYEIYTVFKDSKGSVWFGTGNFGACRYDGKSIRWLSEREMSEMDEGPAPGVRSIVEDKKGNFWFSSNVNNKYQLMSNENSVQTADLNYQRLSGIETSQKAGLANFFNSMTIDNEGHLWMATYDAGVWKQDGKELTFFPIKDGEKDVLIFSIYKDKEGNIWIGTFNSSAWKFNGKTFEKFIIP